MYIYIYIYIYQCFGGALRVEIALPNLPNLFTFFRLFPTFPRANFSAQARWFWDFPSVSRLRLACFRLLLACFAWFVAGLFLCTGAVVSGLSACFLPSPGLLLACFCFALACLLLAFFVHRRSVLCTSRLLLARFLLALGLLCLACVLPPLGRFSAQARWFVHVWPALSGLLLARFVWPLLSGSGLLCPGRGQKIVHF